MNYYNVISKSYNKLYKEEQIEKIKIIKKFVKGKILDVGCGTFFSEKFFKNIIGLDPSIGMLKKGKGDRICCKAENLPFKDKSFDTVISVTAIQNFNDIKKAIKEMKRVAKNKIIITTFKKSTKLGYIKDILRDFREIKEEKDVIFVR